jgi:hypothetical protein
MQTVTLRARADHDGILHLEIPIQFRNQELEIVLVMQPIPQEGVDEMGYFEATYGAFADEPLERNQPLLPDVRGEVAYGQQRPSL